MNCTHLPFNAGHLFSKFDTDYALQSPELRAFYLYDPNMAGIKAAIEIRKSFAGDRTTLVDVFKKQYSQLTEVSPSSYHLIEELLKDTVFTVTTAHQPVLFSGPVYFIYKAISAIKLAQQINDKTEGEMAIPVMVIGGEDHDRAEINHLYLFGKKIEWGTDQEGAAGRYSLEGMEEVIQHTIEILGNHPNAEELRTTLLKAFQQGRSYGTAMQDFVQMLLGPYGLLVLNMDEPAFKTLFVPIIKDEIINKRSQNLIGSTQAAIDKLGYKPATFLRDINFFYLEKGRRDRIELEGEQYVVQNGGPSFSEIELFNHIEQSPERFSPNVNMRPLYQELILPNLAYIGGGGELAYWAERLEHFKYYDIPFPVLIRRDSFFWIDSSLSKKMTKVGLSFEQLLPDIDQIIANYLEEVSNNELHIGDEKKIIEGQLNSIATKGGMIDPTLKPAFEAEASRIIKSLESLESRMVRAEKHKHEVAINQIRQLKEKLFPGNGLQERHDNFMGFYLKYGRCFFEELLLQSDPLRSELKIILDEG